METDGGTEATAGSSGDAAERPSDAYLRISDDGAVVEYNQAAKTLLSVPGSEFAETQLSELSQTVLSSAYETATAADTEQSFEAYDEQLERLVAGTAVPIAGDVVFMLREGDSEQSLQTQLGDERILEQLHGVVTDSSRSPDEKIQSLLAIGANWLGTEYGFLTRIHDGTQRIVHSVGDNPELEPGSTTPLSRAYCRRTIGREKPLAVTDAPNEGWEDDPAYEEYGLDCYLGSTIFVDGEQYGTVCFADPDAREKPFTEQERTFIEVLTDWIHYQLEQQSYERELETQQAYMESLIDSLPDPLYAFELSGELARWNSRLEEVMGYDADELNGMDATSFVVDADRERIDDAMQSARSGNRVSVETTLKTRTEEEIPYQLSGAPLYDPQNEIIGVAGIGRDISEQKAVEEQLSGILSATRSLMQARDREHVAEIALNAARDVLGFDIGLFRLYNSDDKTLEPAAATSDAEAMLGERPVYDLNSGYPGEVFTTGEARMIRDFEKEEYDQPASLRSALYYPVGVHGTMSIGSTEPDAFDERDEQMLALLGTSAAAACMRAKREQEVREARKHTELVLDRVNGLIENTIEVLVQSTTRDEIEQGVVNQLAAAEPYTFAWIGRPDVASETISPTAWAGQSPLSVQGQTFELNRQGEPVSDAYHTGTPQLVTDLSGGGYGQWATILEDSAVDALIVLPLTYKDTTYGVLTVLAEDASAFDERERVVLEALGRAVANAINAVERGRILDATEIIELEFAIDDSKLLFSRLSATANCQLEAVGTNYRSDGAVKLYLTATGVDPEEFLDVVESDGETSDVTCIVAHEDECLVELTVEESLLATLTEYGAVPQRVVASNGTARITVELPYEAEARELFDLVNKQYPGTDLLGYHERERPMETRQDFKASLSDRLTDRQETALRTAYLGGFFEWPREVDGNDLADAMDISRPTYHQHLRAAQGKVFEELFE